MLEKQLDIDCKRKVYYKKVLQSVAKQQQRPLNARYLQKNIIQKVPFTAKLKKEIQRPAKRNMN